MKFQKATKKQSKLRMTLDGPSGSGKTFTALRVAHGLGSKIALIDTERGSASKYAGETVGDVKFEFDVLELESHSPDEYISAIEAANKAGYDVLIIDSLSHAWAGTDGALELVDKAKLRSQGGNDFTAWRDVSKSHNKLVDTILRSRCHVIATMRVKTEYVMEERVNKRGKTITVPVKVGLKPIQRDGVEYEFDVVGDLNTDNVLAISKSRCSAISGDVIEKPGPKLAETLLNWLSDGVDPLAPVRHCEALLKAAGTPAERDAAIDEVKKLGLAQGSPERARLVEMLTECNARIEDAAQRAWEASESQESQAEAMR
jgi:hypothetical protein